MESRKGLNQEEVVLEAPQGDLPDSRPKGGKAPQGTKSGPGPDTAPEPLKVPEGVRPKAGLRALWGFIPFAPGIRKVALQCLRG